MPRLEDIEALPPLERLIMEYFLKHVSVGELAALIDIREAIKSSERTDLVEELDDVIIEITVSKALARLVKKGFLEHGEGCYNLAEDLRKELKEKGEYRVGGVSRLF